MNSPLQIAIDHFNGPSGLAEALGVKSNVVINWRMRQVPAEYCPDIEHVTGGKVTCEELRPDVNWAVLRDGCCRDG